MSAVLIGEQLFLSQLTEGSPAHWPNPQEGKRQTLKVCSGMPAHMCVGRFKKKCVKWHPEQKHTWWTQQTSHWQTTQQLHTGSTLALAGFSLHLPPLTLPRSEKRNSYLVPRCEKLIYVPLCILSLWPPPTSFRQFHLGPSGFDVG